MCSKGILGNTQAWQVYGNNIVAPRALTLCPTYFTDPENRLGQVTARTVTEAELKTRIAAAAADNNPRLLEDLQEVVHMAPRSSTIFHELMHVLLGLEATVPGSEEYYDITETMQLGIELSSRNAESYTLAAVGYWYTKNTVREPEFCGGYTTEKRI